MYLCVCLQIFLKKKYWIEFWRGFLQMGRSKFQNKNSTKDRGSQSFKSKFSNLFSDLPSTIGEESFGFSLFKKYSSSAIVSNFNFHLNMFIFNLVVINFAPGRGPSWGDPGRREPPPRVWLPLTTCYLDPGIIRIL